MNLTNWQKVVLSDLVTIAGESIDPPKHPDEIFHLFSIPAYDNNRTPEVVRGDEIGSVKRTIKPNDCLFSKLNPRINRVWIVSPKEQYQQIATPEFWALRVNSGVELLPTFLAYILSWEKFREDVIGREEAATKSRSRLKPEQLLSKKIPLPPLPEQERIVRLLDEAESLRATRESANARMEEFVPALFHEIFGDLREIEKMQWELIPVGEFAKISYGLADKLDSHTLPENGTRIITISNVTLDGTLNLSVERYSLVDISAREKAKLKYGDLLFNWRNGSEFHVGKTAFWEEQIAGEVLHVSFLLKIRSVESKVDSLYLWVLLNLLRKNGFFAKSRFQVNTKFNASELSALKLPLPPLALQREFAARVGEARGVQSAQGKSSEKIEALYQSMLSRAFAGEL